MFLSVECYTARSAAVQQYHTQKFPLLLALLLLCVSYQLATSTQWRESILFYKVHDMGIRLMVMYVFVLLVPRYLLKGPQL